MRHIINKYTVVAILLLMTVPTLQAQDAFYIYRNDGNFDGFFFDEVERMSYSKFDLDSVEHDVYVVQEIQTVDSLYRIPLAAIDSIGLQQPEIRLSPKAKFVCESPIQPYITYARNGYIVVNNLPYEFVPEVGDVLIGLPTDKNASELYTDGSFSCVVESIEFDRWDYNQRIIRGHAVEQLSDVFDQYITVENLTIDPQGKIIRRIAGCDENGIPRRASDSYENTLFDINGTFTHEWKPTSNSFVNLSAEVGVKMKMRVAYEINWNRFFVKLSRDLIIKPKPSINMGLSTSFEGTIADIIGLPAIMFPASCPIFETNPVPEIFMRAGGELKASFNLPAVELGIGDHVIIDSNNLFPISYGLHLTPKADEIDKDMLDLSSEVSMSGFFQTGVKFQADLSTASWFQKLFNGKIGLYLYCGPRVEASGSISADILNFEGVKLYDNLKSINLNLAWLSLNLEAKATARSWWSDPVERTFFSKNWSFFTDTIGIVPLFDQPTVKVNGQNATITLHPRRKTLPSNYLSIDINRGEDTLVETIGEWPYYAAMKKDSTTYQASTTLEPGIYHARPRIKIANYNPLLGPRSNDFYIWPDQITKVDFYYTSIKAVDEEEKDTLLYSPHIWTLPVNGVRDNDTYHISTSVDIEEPDANVKSTVSVDFYYSIKNDPITGIGLHLDRGSYIRNTNYNWKDEWDTGYCITEGSIEESFSWDNSDSSYPTSKPSSKIGTSNLESETNVSGMHHYTTITTVYDNEGIVISKETNEGDITPTIGTIYTTLYQQ